MSCELKTTKLRDIILSTDMSGSKLISSYVSSYVDEALVAYVKNDLLGNISALNYDESTLISTNNTLSVLKIPNQGSLATKNYENISSDITNTISCYQLENNKASLSVKLGDMHPIKLRATFETDSGEIDYFYAFVDRLK